MRASHRRAGNLIVAGVLLGSITTVSALEEQTVLVLYSDPALLPATAAFTDGLREGLQSSRMTLEAQYLDISRFAGDADERAFAQWLGTRYQDRQIPAVVALAVPASAFALRFAETIWPGAKVVHAAIDGDQLAAATKRGDPVVPRVLDYRRTLEAALTLLPDVRQVTLVAGASAQDRRWLNQAEVSLAPLRERIHVTRLAGLRWRDTLDQVARLPEHSIAVPVCFFADADDRTFVNAEAVMDITRAANRPAFVTSLTWIGSGAVGGYVMDPIGIGRQTARMVLSVLNREEQPNLPERDGGNRWIFDAVQLQRWNIAERRLPAGSDVINRQPSLWSQYRWYVLGAVSLIALQTLLIGGLLVQRSRRRRAEQTVRTSEAALRLSYERIRQLAGRLIGAQESARARIARDLHDDVCQELASMAMAVGDMNQRQAEMPDVQIQHTLSALHRRTLDLADGVRRLSHDLHPSTLRHVGLAAALETHCIEVEHRYDVQVSFNAPADLRELHGEAAVALFRIGQEALRNAATHGGARRISLSITKEGDSVVLAVKDDGAGFDCEEIRRRGDGLGLVSMEERARLVGGELVVETAAGQGTTVRARVPSAGGARIERRRLRRMDATTELEDGAVLGDAANWSSS